MKRYISKFFKVKISSKYTPKRTKLHHLKKFSRGNIPPNPLAQRMAFKFPNLKIQLSPPPPPQILGTLLH